MMEQNAESNRTIFVGGIPGYLKKGDIFKLFSKFGKIRNIKLQYRPEAPHLNKGFCILKMQKTQHAQTIISYRQIPLPGGRFLVCKPYLQGKKLQDAILCHDKRRLILKQLPPTMTETTIRQFCEEHFGPVELVFIFQSDDRLVTYSQGKKKTASVTFVSGHQVDAVFGSIDLHERILNVEGASLLAQRFIFQPNTVENYENHSQNVRDFSEGVPNTNHKKPISRDQPSPSNPEKVELDTRPSPETEIFIRDLAHVHDNIRFNLVYKRNNRQTSRPMVLERNPLLSPQSSHKEPGVTCTSVQAVHKPVSLRSGPWN